MFKKFSLGAELQPLRASPTMSFPQTCRFLEVGQGGGCGQQSLCPPWRSSCTSGCQSQSSFPPIPSQPWPRQPPLRVSFWKYQRPQRIRRSLVFSPCAITLTAEGWCYPNNKEVYNTFVTVCVFTHTHMWLSYCRSSLSGQILWAGKAEKGVTWPLLTTYGAKFQICASDL